MFLKFWKRSVFTAADFFKQSKKKIAVFQSGFKALHTTESALLRVFNDILLTADSGNSVLFVLLNLTAAFDAVDHNILISRVEHHVGIRGTALEWFRSYLFDRSFSVSLGKFYSSSAPHDPSITFFLGFMYFPLAFFKKEKSFFFQLRQLSKVKPVT